MAKPAVCSNPECQHEIKDGWTFCRPCAVAHVRGEVPYLEPCPSFDFDGVACRECGYAEIVHPGRGLRRNAQIEPSYLPPSLMSSA